jgi:hypothetical protein
MNFLISPYDQDFRLEDLEERLADGSEVTKLMLTV